MLFKIHKIKKGRDNMKKIFSIILLITLTFSFAGISDSKAASVEFKEIQTFFEEYSEVEQSWSEGKLKRGESLYGPDDEKIGYMYRIFNNNLQQGYILHLDGFGIVEATFEGEDLASNINGKVYYLLPGRFLSKSDYYDIINNSASEQDEFDTEEDDIYPVSRSVVSTGISVTGNPLTNTVTIENYDYTINTSHVMDLSSNYSSYSTSTSAKFYIENTPDYHNYSYGPISNGCLPTSAAMLIAYYDNEMYNTFTDIEGPFAAQFPLDHADDPDLVDELIIEMSDYTGNCAHYPTGEIIYPHFICHMVTGNQTIAGITNFLDDANHDEWVAIADQFDTSVGQYQQLINLGNPSIIIIENHPIYNPGGIGHAVLGMGHYAAYMSQPGIIVHDDLSSTSKEIWLSYSVAEWFIFLYTE